MVKKIGWVKIGENEEKIIKKLSKKVKPEKIPPAKFENLLFPGKLPLGPMYVFEIFLFHFADERKIRSRKFEALVELADTEGTLSYIDCLEILREKGRKIAPLDEVYKNLFRPELKFSRWAYNLEKRMKEFLYPPIGGITTEYIIYNGEESKLIGRDPSIQKEDDKYAILVEDYKVKPEDEEMESFVEKYLRENSDIPSDVKINVDTIDEGLVNLIIDSDSTYKKLEITTYANGLQPIFVR